MKMKLKLLFYRQNCNIEEQNQVNEVVGLFQSILVVHTFNWSILGSAQLRYLFREKVKNAMAERERTAASLLR